ncbi:MAG: hypothetical protein AB7F91_17850 [Parvularculaceae bacterium]
MAKEPIVSALIKERRNVLARLRDHEAIVCDLKTTLSHMDATLFHLGYYPDGAEAPKKPMAAGLFYNGELPRIMLTLMRKNPDGLALREIVEMVCQQKGWETDDTRFNRELRLKISRTLDRQRLKGVVERVGDEPVGVWRIAPC